MKPTKNGGTYVGVSVPNPQASDPVIPQIAASDGLPIVQEAMGSEIQPGERTHRKEVATKKTAVSRRKISQRDASAPAPFLFEKLGQSLRVKSYLNSSDKKAFIVQIPVWHNHDWYAAPVMNPNSDFPHSGYGLSDFTNKPEAANYCSEIVGAMRNGSPIRFTVSLSDRWFGDHRSLSGPNVERIFPNKDWCQVSVNLSDYSAVPDRGLGGTLVFCPRPKATTAIVPADAFRIQEWAAYHPQEIRIPPSINQIEKLTNLPPEVIKVAAKLMGENGLILPAASLNFWPHLAAALTSLNHIAGISVETLADAVWMWAQEFHANYKKNGGWPQELIDVYEAVKCSRELARLMQRKRGVLRSEFVLSQHKKALEAKNGGGAA